jgi:hypothetical protein
VNTIRDDIEGGKRLNTLAKHRNSTAGRRGIFRRSGHRESLPFGNIFPQTSDAFK